MKTGELFIEQVLIGALVLAIGICPWVVAQYTDIKDFVVEHSDVIGSLIALSGAIIVGLSFLLGIIFDRFADSLMARLEQHHRLQFTCKMLKKTKILELPIETWSDLFPEDHFRLVMLRESDGILEWMDYHRSRIRLSRALAIYVPGLTLAIVIGFFKSEICPWGLIFIPATYILAALIAQLLNYFGYKLPRTDESEGFEKYQKRQGRSTFIVEVILCDPTIWACIALLLVAFIFSYMMSSMELVKLVLASMYLTSLSFWSWWRINETYRVYLLKIGNRSIDNLIR